MDTTVVFRHCGPRRGVPMKHISVKMKKISVSMNDANVSMKTVECRGSKMSVSRKAPRPTRALPRGLSVPQEEAPPLPYSARTPPVAVNVMHHLSLFIIFD